MHERLTLRPTRADEKHLPWVDYSTLTAVNTCPRWGIINSFQGKKLSTPSNRSMALEAGSAMHDVFACIRMFDLMDHCTKITGKIPDDVYAHGVMLFNNKSEMAGVKSRWEQMVQYFDSREDANTRATQMSLYCLETSGFHDDANDRKRTLRNLEECTIYYLSRYPLRRFIPLYIPNRFIGVEMGFDLIIEELQLRFVGKVDGVCIDLDRDKKLEIHENKTGSRIDQSWMDTMVTTHQITCYIIAANVVLGRAGDIDSAVAWGLQVPIPAKSVWGDASARVNVSRDNSSFLDWSHWLQHTVAMMRQYNDDAANAPAYTHSCGRYFSTCPFIPFCAAPLDERRKVLKDEMVYSRWSPLGEGEE